MKKYIFLLLLIFFGSFLLYYNNYNFEYINDGNNLNKKTNNMISIMLETEAKSGKYVSSTVDNWPSDNYVFNKKLSKCENGSLLYWDDINKTVVMEGDTSDKCYAYFKVYTEPSLFDSCDTNTTFSDCIKSYANLGFEKTSIYIHDSNLSNGANDNSYRYAGADPNNYVCFGSSVETCPDDNLYRIIGVFDNRVKLIKADYATTSLLGMDGDYKGLYSYITTNYKGSISLSSLYSYYWNYNNDTTLNSGNGSNTWSTSLLNKVNLNKNFINNIGNKWANMISLNTWKVGGNTYQNVRDVTPLVSYQNEIINPVSTNTTDEAIEYNAKIGLMYISDYGFATSSNSWTTNLSSYNASSALNNNWMYMGLYEWTISRYSGIAHGTFLVLNSGSIGNGISKNDYCIRPVFYLLPSIKYLSGEGTKKDPVRITI